MPSNADKILKAAISLWSEKGYRAMTMRELAKRASMGASSLYSHFKSKEEIVQYLYERLNAQALDTLREQDRGDAISTMVQFTRIKLKLLSPHRSAMPALLKEAIDPESALSPVSAQSGSTLQRNIQVFKEPLEGQVPEGSVETYARLLWAVHIAVIVYWLHDRSDEQANTTALLEELQGLSKMQLMMLGLASKASGASRILELLMAVVQPPAAAKTAAVEQEEPPAQSADIMVVGGGPIGCIYAGFLKQLRPQTRVLVLERNDEPGHKIGESTLSGFCKALRTLGVRQEAMQKLFYPKNGLGFFHLTEATPKLQSASEYILETFDETFQVERRVLDTLIMSAMRKLGVDIIQGAHVDLSASTFGTSGSDVVYSIGAQQYRAKARWVVDATGPAHGLAAHHKLWTDDGLPFQSSSVWTYWRGHTPLAEQKGWPAAAKFPRDEYTQHFCFREGWFWYIPLRSWQNAPTSNLQRAIDRLTEPGRRALPDRLEQAYGCPTEPILSLGLTLRSDRDSIVADDPQAAFEQYCARYPALLKTLEGAEQISAPYGGATFQSRRRYRGYARQVVGQGWLALGDAAFFVDPLISPGLTGGTATAYRAAEVTAKALDQNELHETSFEPYQTFVRELHDALERDNQLVYMSFNHPRAMALIQRFQEIDSRRHFLSYEKERYGPADINVWGILNPVYQKLQKEVWALMREHEHDQRAPVLEQRPQDYEKMCEALETRLGDYLSSNRSLTPYAVANEGS